MSEFKGLQAGLAPLGEALASLEASSPEDAASVDAWLLRANTAEAEIRRLEARLLGVFRLRALEVDPDKAMYGPGMREKVLQACGEAEELVLRWAQVELMRARMSTLHGEQSDAASAAAAEAERARQNEQTAAALVSAAAAVEEAAHRQREEAARALEQVTARREAAARALASSGATIPILAPSEADAAILAARLAFTGAALDKERALERVRAAYTAHEYGDMVQVACLLLSNVRKFPEERSFRALRLRNQLIHVHFSAREGGLPLLRALGFALRDAEMDEPLLVLEEPNVERDFEKWADWFDVLKANIARLEAELRVLRLAVLPTAVKGSMHVPNDESLPRHRQGPQPQVATLAGSGM